MAYNKSKKERMILSIVLTKAKENPLTELLSPKGGLFAPCGLPKPLPLGEVALRSNDGEGKLTSQEYLHSDRHWLLSERCYRCAFCFSVASLPSQSRSARQLSQRESLWQAGQAHAGRAKFDFIGNSSALLQRAVASGQYPLSSCCGSL